LLSEFDTLMKAYKLSAVLCLGDSTVGNPELAYVVRAFLPRGGVYLKKVNEEPLLVVSNIDLGNARRGVVKNIQTYRDYNYHELLRKHGRQKAYIEFLTNLLKKNKVRGKIGIYGKIPALTAIELAYTLRKKGFRVVSQQRPSIIDLLRRKKDDWEINSMKSVAERTVEVVREVERLLSELDIRNGVATLDGREITIGYIKKTVRRLCVEKELNLPEDHIFAVGRSSADPHETGVDNDIIGEGEPIVFDIFPQDMKTGYWYDFTRTYVLGKPSDTLAKMYEDVLEAQNIAIENMREGVKCREVMETVCSFFNKRGRRTIMDGEFDRGFIHSLGHGVGLTIGEEPYLTIGEEETLETRMVATVEPGLYYPEVGGVRIEDTVVIEENRAKPLAEHRKELTL